MRSFEQVVHEYANYATGGAGSKSARQSLARRAAADLQDFFTRKNRWNTYNRKVSVRLWGSETATIAALASGSLVTLSSGTTDTKWVGQDVSFAGVPASFTITRLNDASSFIIDPPYDASLTAQAAGATVTIRQRRVGLPCNYGKLLSPVYHDKNPVRVITSAELNRAWMYGNSSGSGARICSISGGFMQIWPANAGYLSYDYSFMPEALFRYDAGRANVDPSLLRRVTGVNTRWSLLPAAAKGMVFESQENIDYGGITDAYGITLASNNTTLHIDADWGGVTGQNFDYVVSTDISTPPYMDKAILKMAMASGGKATTAEVEMAILNAISADHRSEDIDTVTDTGWGATVTQGGRSDYVIRL